jgi:hypothetical protein
MIVLANNRFLKRPIGNPIPFASLRTIPFLAQDGLPVTRANDAVVDATQLPPWLGAPAPLACTGTAATAQLPVANAGANNLTVATGATGIRNDSNSRRKNPICPPEVFPA